MEDTDRSFITQGEINTLEESLKRFGKPCLLEQLDMRLELIRKNKETQESHIKILKSVDKDLLKLSRIHHPDKAIGEKKLEEEVKVAQDLQTALNTTRTVLKALTEVFLKDIDVHYKYEYFAKLNINTLINEKQIELEINNVLCKISRLSEIKRMNIIGEIRKFLLNCHNGLRKFLDDSKYEFMWHRDEALHHLHLCIEGYEMLKMECELLVEECSDDNDENTKKTIEKISKKCVRESEILQELEKVAKRSLDGSFEFFSLHYLNYINPMKSEIEYLVSPFTYYVNVLMICSVMVAKKTGGQKVLSKIGNFFYKYLPGGPTVESIDIFDEPALLEAYHLASYFNNKNNYKEVEAILIKKGHRVIESSIIREVFNETVKGIEQRLGERFDINCYKEGKSNREQFNERLIELSDKFKEEEKKLLEKFKLFEQETVARKECIVLSGDCEIAGQKCHKYPTSKHEDFKENVESAQNIDGIEKTAQHVNQFSECPIDCTQNISNSVIHQTSSANENGYSTDFSRYKDETNIKQIPQRESSWLEVSDDTVVFGEIQLNTKAGSTSPENTSGCENMKHSAQVTTDQWHNCSREHNECSIMHAEKISGHRKDQLHEESLSDPQIKYVSLQQTEDDKVQLNTRAVITYPEIISDYQNTNQTTKMDLQNDFRNEYDECSKMHVEEIPCFGRDQISKESLIGQFSKCVTDKQNGILKTDHQNCQRENGGEKNDKVAKIIQKGYEENFQPEARIEAKNDWIIL